MARELGPDNIRINAVAPSVIQTDLVETLLDEVKSYIMEAIPLHRMGTNAFLYLNSMTKSTLQRMGNSIGCSI